MKRNLLYLVGFLLAATTVFSGYSDDDLSYHDLVPNTQELVINLNEISGGIIQVVQGDGSYKTTGPNEDVTTAIAEGNKVKATALKAGGIDLSITDWVKMGTNVKVIVDRLSELALSNSTITMYPGENKTANAYTRNRSYKVTVGKESVVGATVDEKGHIQIESLAPGNATVITTDRLNKSAEFSVKAIKRLAVDNNEETTYLTIGESLIIKILDGNGDHTCINNGSATYLKCTTVENRTGIIVGGLKRYRFNKAVTIKDQEGESVSINIVYTDNLYLENPSYRYLIAGSPLYQLVSTSAVGFITHPEESNMFETAIKGVGTYVDGFAVQFTGDLTKGNKGDAVLYKVARNAVDKKMKYPVEDCRIDRVEDD